MKSLRLILLIAIIQPFFYLINGQAIDISKLKKYGAIYKDSSIFPGWAIETEVVRGLIQIGNPDLTDMGLNTTSFGEPGNANNKSDINGVVSLGDGGYAVLSFESPIINGPGPDFAVFENAFNENFLELAFVEVSNDGVNFTRFPSYSLTQTNNQTGSFSFLDPENIHNLAGIYPGGYGTPFDLDDLKDSLNIDINQVNYVKIIDVVGSINESYASYDCQGNIINDPWPTPFWNGGFDLDAVGVINSQKNTGIKKVNIHSSKSKIKVYPNPFIDKLFIENVSPTAKIQICDITGKELLRINNPTEKPYIEINPSFKKGIYYLHITERTKKTCIPIIK